VQGIYGCVDDAFEGGGSWFEGGSLLGWLTNGWVGLLENS
jgi:hypothetical protein